MSALLIRSALAGLVAYRLARAVAVDTISEPARDWIYCRAYKVYRPKPGTAEPHAELRSRPWSWAYGLASCPFCCSWWLALAVFVAWVGEWSMNCAVGAVAAAGVASVLTFADKAAIGD